MGFALQSLPLAFSTDFSSKSVPLLALGNPHIFIWGFATELPQSLLGF
jgi:hypothetical protein